MELAIGLFTLVLVVCALTVFARYIVRSLEIQNHIRSSSAIVSDKIDLDEYESSKIFGVKSLKISEPRGR